MNDKTNKMMCASSEYLGQPRHRPNQSLCCPHEETLSPWLPIKRTAKTLIRLGRSPGWSEIGHFVGFVMLWPIWVFVYAIFEILLSLKL